MELTKKLKFMFWLVLANTALAIAVITLKEMGIK